MRRSCIWAECELTGPRATGTISPAVADLPNRRRMLLASLLRSSHLDYGIADWLSAE